LEFALLNREAGLPLNFWGNVRFEKDFCPDAAAILASGGLLGVSAGLEVATEKGLKRLGKGIAPEGAVRACAAFKEAGVLTHAYLIYGYWDEDEGELVDSAETLRQFFASGLLDSAFWHKFVLTRHSRVYAEKRRGLHPALTVKGDIENKTTETVFAHNDLSFEGEEKFDKYAEGLEKLLGAWRQGETEIPVRAAFSFKVKAPSVSPDYVASLLDKYARERDRDRAALPAEGTSLAGKRVLFLGSIPKTRREGKSISWRWRLAEQTPKVETSREGGKDEAGKLAALLKSASRGKGMEAPGVFSTLEQISGKAGAERIWKKLRESGLAVYNYS
jgi:hypothetical protein